jgi:hypothetical protein
MIRLISNGLRAVLFLSPLYTVNLIAQYALNAVRIQANMVMKTTIS